jgi:hypothetical protein
MSSKLTFFVILLISIFSFIAGKYSTDSENNREQLNAIFAATDLAYDRWGDVMLLEHLHERVEEDPNAAKTQFILAISLIYRDNETSNDVFDTKFVLNTSAHKSNVAVEEFLKKHGFAKCMNLIKSELIACNLNAVEDDV